MIKTDKIKQIVDLILNKDQSGGYSIAQFNTALEMANQDLFRSRYGLTEEYQKDNASARVSYEVTQKVKDDMRVFKETKLLQSIEGRFAIPSDYLHMTSLNIAIKNGSCSEASSLGNPIESMTDSELGERLSDYLKKPNEKNPVCLLDAEEIHVYPKTIKAVSLTYLREPLTPKWAFDLVDDTAVYNDADSVDFEWSPILANDIARLVLSYMGVNIRDNDISNYADKTIARGV